MQGNSIQVGIESLNPWIGGTVVKVHRLIAILDQVHDVPVPLVPIQEVVHDILMPALVVRNVTIKRMVGQLLGHLDGNNPFSLTPGSWIAEIFPSRVLGDEVTSSSGSCMTRWSGSSRCRT